MEGRHLGLLALLAVLAAAGCDRSLTGPGGEAADHRPIVAADDPDLPWIELDALQFRGRDEGGLISVDLALQDIEVRFWPSPAFDPGPDWNPPVRWLQFLHAGSSGSGANAIAGSGRIQETPQEISGLGTISAFVTGTYTTPNGTERITGKLIFDLSTALIEPIKGGSFFESCGITCILIGLVPRLEPDPQYSLPPIDLVGRLGLRPRPGFTSISVGEQHSCALTVDGAAHCWGRNESGQLGDGTTTSPLTPVAVVGGHLFQEISAGDRYTCALTIAGAAYCWGLNDSGQIGDGTTTNHSRPTAVVGGRTFHSITAGGRHTCGVNEADGMAYCWGRNASGQLGDGTTTDSTVPVAVQGGLAFEAITAGGGHSCGLVPGGAAYCWGQNGGLLGDGALENRTSPVAVSGLHAFAAIDAGASHTCAVTMAGEGFCWGFNDHGQIGDGTTMDWDEPFALGFIAFLEGISAGDQVTCAWTPEGLAICWGRNDVGQVGRGDTDFTDIAHPSMVWNYPGRLDLRFSVVSVGEFHACALTEEGRAFCWGGNEGLLGDGTRTDSAAPVAVSPF